jgi:pimeloyl-ACP methyl ester carboxylesterase
MFDFGSPVGFRLATRHPERVQGLVLQNGNAYEEGLGPNMQALKAYWQDRAANEAAIRGFLRLDTTRAQYLEASPTRQPSTRTCGSSTSAISSCPDVTKSCSTRSTTTRATSSCIRAGTSTCVPTGRRHCFHGGQNDRFFPPEGARAYLHDLPDAALHLLDTGHFATATHSEEIADLIAGFLETRLAEQQYA